MFVKCIVSTRPTYSYSLSAANTALRQLVSWYTETDCYRGIQCGPIFLKIFWIITRIGVKLRLASHFTLAGHFPLNVSLSRPCPSLYEIGAIL